METSLLKLTMILLIAPALFSNQCLSAPSLIELDLTTAIPDNPSEKAKVTLVCTMDAENVTLNFAHLMELTISERLGETLCPRTLASINVLMPKKCVTYADNSQVTASGSLAPNRGELRVDALKGKDDVDVVDFVCVAKYLDHGFQTRTVSARRKNTVSKLFSLMAHANSEISTKLRDFDYLNDKLDNVTRMLTNLKNTAAANQATLQSLTKATSCNELVKRHQASSPRQQVSWPDGTKVLCDTETDGGGWTVLQRRQDGQESFSRGWTEYVNGFGSLSGDFWMGLETMHHLMEEGPQELRVDFTYKGLKYHAKYSTFEILNASTHYKLRVGGYSGTAGDSLGYHNNIPFSTFDADHDNRPGNCARIRRSAWWYNRCALADLNGVWADTKQWRGLVWASVSEYGSATFTEMKSRPRYRGL